MDGARKLLVYYVVHFLPPPITLLISGDYLILYPLQRQAFYSRIIKMAGEKPIADHESSDAPGDSLKRKKKRVAGALLQMQPASKPREAPGAALGHALEQLAPKPDKDPKKAPAKPEATDDSADEARASERLTSDELATAAAELIKARTDDLQVEQQVTVPDSPEAEAIEADTAYLKAVNDRVAAGEAPLAAIDAQYAETVGLPLGAVLDEVAGTSDSETAETVATDTEADAGEPEEVDISSNTSGEINFGRTADDDTPANAAPDYLAVATIGSVLGGLVGGFMKRRFGPAAPNHAMRTVQRSLEREVRQLQERLILRETQIRQLVRERDTFDYAAEPPTAKTEQKLPRTEAPKAEAVATKVAVERLPLADVLDMAEKIKVDNTNVREIFESHRISERGLRRIVRESLVSGNMRKVLKQELLIKAMGPELDPLYRDQPIGSQTAAAAVATDLEGEHSPSPAQPSAPGVASKLLPQSLPIQRQMASPALLIANVAALIILCILIALLLIILVAR